MAQGIRFPRFPALPTGVHEPFNALGCPAGSWTPLGMVGGLTGSCPSPSLEIGGLDGRIL